VAEVVGAALVGLAVVGDEEGVVGDPWGPVEPVVIAA
jgi:hypothetical protein